MKAQMIMYT